MARTSQSKIIAISHNPQTNMLWLIAWQLGYPEVVNTPRSVVVIRGAVVQFPTCPTPFMKIPTKMPLSA
jgi:hypothetical protein